MSFQFNWPAFSEDLVQLAKSQLTQALAHGKTPDNIADKIIVSELYMGTIAPELEIMEISDLTEDRFKGIFKLVYKGDAWIGLQTKVQANPLYRPPRKSGVGYPRGMLAADKPLIVPMNIKISNVCLRGVIVLVLDKEKGVTLVFKNDPLESVSVNSTFDNVPNIRRLLQRQIEAQLRNLFQEDLPMMIHKISLSVLAKQKQKRTPIPQSTQSNSFVGSPPSLMRSSSMPQLPVGPGMSDMNRTDLFSQDTCSRYPHPSNTHRIPVIGSQGSLERTESLPPRYPTVPASNTSASGNSPNYLLHHDPIHTPSSVGYPSNSDTSSYAPQSSHHGNHGYVLYRRLSLSTHSENSDMGLQKLADPHDPFYKKTKRKGESSLTLSTSAANKGPSSVSDSSDDGALSFSTRGVFTFGLSAAKNTPSHVWKMLFPSSASSNGENPSIEPPSSPLVGEARPSDDIYDANRTPVQRHAQLVSQSSNAITADERKSLGLGRRPSNETDVYGSRRDPLDAANPLTRRYLLSTARTVSNSSIKSTSSRDRDRPTQTAFVDDVSTHTTFHHDRSDSMNTIKTISTAYSFSRERHGGSSEMTEDESDVNPNSVYSPAMVRKVQASEMVWHRPESDLMGRQYLAPLPPPRDPHIHTHEGSHYPSGYIHDSSFRRVGSDHHLHSDHTSTTDQMPPYDAPHSAYYSFDNNHSPVSLEDENKQHILEPSENQLAAHLANLLNAHQTISPNSRDLEHFTSRTARGPYGVGHGYNAALHQSGSSIHLLSMNMSSSSVNSLGTGLARSGNDEQLSSSYKSSHSGDASIALSTSGVVLSSDMTHTSLPTQETLGLNMQPSTVETTGTRSLVTSSSQPPQQHQQMMYSSSLYSPPSSVSHGHHSSSNLPMTPSSSTHSLPLRKEKLVSKSVHRIKVPSGFLKATSSSGRGSSASSVVSGSRVSGTVSEARGKDRISRRDKEWNPTSQNGIQNGLDRIDEAQSDGQTTSHKQTRSVTGSLYETQREGRYQETSATSHSRR